MAEIVVGQLYALNPSVVSLPMYSGQCASLLAVLGLVLETSQQGDLMTPSQFQARVRARRWGRKIDCQNQHRRLGGVLEHKDISANTVK